MTAELKKFGEAPSAASSIPPPPDDLRHVDRLATIGWVARGVIHELGTKLSVASAHAEMIASGEASGDTARQSARIIVQQIELMSDRVKRLLAFAHEETSAREPVDLRAVVRHTTELFVPLAAKEGVTLRMAQGEPLEVVADTTQIEQVVATLVHNAIQACSWGGSVGVSIHEPTEDDAVFACIEVTDDGVGISPEAQRRIFEPFFSTKDGSEGSGLGLSVADSIARDHGGWIDVESEPGKGSRFRVRLPRPSRLGR